LGPGADRAPAPRAGAPRAEEAPLAGARRRSAPAGLLGVMAYQVTAGPFIGRPQELARLRDLLAGATDGDGEPLVALLGGEAGVGKTRLVEQLAATASGQGVRVLSGRCVPLGEEGVPFAPVIEALRGLAGHLDPAELEAGAAPARAGP